MAVSTTNMTKHPKIQRYGTINPGHNLIKIVIDFSKTSVDTADDDWTILNINDDWILGGGWTRMSTASTSAATCDIGTAGDGTELDTAIDLSSATTTWTAMDTMVVETEIIPTADGYIFLNFNSAAVSDGVLEILLTILVEPGNDSITG